MVDIRGLDKVKVLMALWKASKCQGLSFMGYAPLTEGQAMAEIINRTHNGRCWFDYLNGKVLKVDLGGVEFDERYFDEDNGEGAAQRAVDSIR